MNDIFYLHKFVKKKKKKETKEIRREILLVVERADFSPLRRNRLGLGLGLGFKTCGKNF